MHFISDFILIITELLYGPSIHLHIYPISWLTKEPGSSVKRLRLRAGWPGFDSWLGQGYFLTQPPIQWIPGAFVLGVRRPGHEADHSPPPSVEVRNAWSYTSTPPYVFMTWYLVKHGGNFTFSFTVTVKNWLDSDACLARMRRVVITRDQKTSTDFQFCNSFLSVLSLIPPPPPSSGHEIRSIKDLFRADDCVYCKE
jgi:hypothetical protein